MLNSLTSAARRFHTHSFPPEQKEKVVEKTKMKIRNFSRDFLLNFASNVLVHFTLVLSLLIEVLKSFVVFILRQ